MKKQLPILNFTAAVAALLVFIHAVDYVNHHWFEAADRLIPPACMPLVLGAQWAENNCSLCVLFLFASTFGIAELRRRKTVAAEELGEV